MCFRSEAEIFCQLLSALQDPTPVRIILGSLSLLLLFGCFLFAVVASLFFSSSGAGETQTASRFVVPLVFSSSWTRPPTSTRTPSSTTTSRSTPAPVFFFLSPLCRLWWVLVRFGFGFGGSLSLSLSLSLLVVLLALHACFRCEEKEGVAYKTAPLAMIIIP